MMDDEVFNECPVCGAPFTEPNSWEHAGHDASPLETAIRTIQSAIPGYLKGEMSEHDFAILVLGEVDGKAVNAAMTGARASDGSGA
jgi:hypothetical protein